MPRLRRRLTTSLLLVLALAASPTFAAADVIPIPGVRVAGGPLWNITEGEVFGTLDVLPNIEFIDLQDGVAFNFLLGYGYEGSGDHLFQAGLDVGLYSTENIVSPSLGFRGVIGSVDDDLGGGLRVVAGTGVWFGVFRCEAAYQLLSRHDGVTHDLRIVAGLDVVRLVVAPFLIAFSN